MGSSMTSTPSGCVEQPELLELALDLARDLLGDAGVGVERAAQRRDAGAGAGSSSRAVRRRGAGRAGRHRISAGGRQPRVAAAGGAWRRSRSPTTIGSECRVSSAEPDQLVHRPGADVGRGHVADVREVEGQQRAQLRALELAPCSRASRSVAQPVEVDPLLPVDGVGAEGGCAHGGGTPLSRVCSATTHCVRRH